MKLFDKIFRNRENFEKPDFIQRYDDCFLTNDTQGEKGVKRYTVFDTETTGLDKKTDGILSLGLVQCSAQEIYVSSAREYHIVSSDEAFNSKPQNVEIHGITRNKSRTGLNMVEVVEEFLEVIGNSVLVAHHAGFDVSMVEKEVKKIYPPFKFRNKVIDTAAMAKRIEQPPAYASFSQEDYDLDSLLKRYRIAPLERHTALGDAYSTALLFVKLLALLKKRGVAYHFFLAFF